MASGWNLWVWLQFRGVVSGCCCKGVYIDILTMIINFPYSTFISSFLAAVQVQVSSFIEQPNRGTLQYTSKSTMKKNQQTRNKTTPQI